MKNCSCGSQLASNALACPKCGKRYTSVVTKIVVVVVVLLVLAFIAMSMEQH
jgi:hypothetical protein